MPMKRLHKGVEALERLRAGNQRFVAGEGSGRTDIVRRAELASQQEPFAVILGCSDSRVPAEYVFDQGLGDLFVIRVAGNIVAPSQIGSVEFAVEAFATPLVLVLGHSNCGAIKATLETLASGVVASTNMSSIVDRISPSVRTVLDVHAGTDPAVQAKHAVRANIRASVDHLRHGSRVLEDRVASGELLVVGAEYSLETGEVDFFEGLPAI